MFRRHCFDEFANIATSTSEFDGKAASLDFIEHALCAGVHRTRHNLLHLMYFSYAAIHV